MSLDQRLTKLEAAPVRVLDKPEDSIPLYEKMQVYRHLWPDEPDHKFTESNYKNLESVRLSELMDRYRDLFKKERD